jgi:hypothetical protein
LTASGFTPSFDSFGHSDTHPWNYFTRLVIDPASSGDFSRALGDDDNISKNSETINNPAIPAPIIISFSFSSFFFLRPVLQILVHAPCHNFATISLVSSASLLVARALVHLHLNRAFTNHYVSCDAIDVCRDAPRLVNLL